MLFRSYTSPCGLAESCVFGKQSLGPFHCGSYLYEHSLSLSYGVILQSSLAIVLSLTLGFSPHPCVSIFGTGYCMIITRSFSWKLASRTSVLTSLLSIRFTSLYLHSAHFSSLLLSRLLQLFHPLDPPSLLRHSFTDTSVQESPPVIHRLRLSASP